MLSTLPITVIMNSASGHDDKQASRAEIEKVLAASGRAFRFLSPERPDELEALAKRAAEEAKRDPGIIVAAGGDGTINTVAGAVAGTDLPFAVVPMGTFNFFARNLGIPLEAGAATQALLDGHARPMPVARVNGRIFLINSSVGLYRRLQEEREQFKRRFGRNKLVAVISGLATLLHHHRVYEVRMEMDGKPVTVRTPMLFFGMNSLQLEKLEVPAASCIERGLLAVLMLRPMSRWKILGFALRGVLHGLNDAENMHTHCASKVTVRWRRARKMKVAVDGETMECDLPLRYEVMRDALNVIVPRNPAPRE
jgi:diacylglycerol kinase family enzyme